MPSISFWNDKLAKELRQIEQVLLQRRGSDVDYQPEVLEMIGKQLRDAKRTKRCLESETMRLPASSDCRQEMEFLLQLYGEQLQSYEEDLSVLQPKEALLGSSSHSSTSSRSSFRNQAFDYNNYLSSSERFRLTSVPSSQSINTSTSDSSTGRSGRTYRRPAVVGDGMRTSF